MNKNQMIKTDPLNRELTTEELYNELNILYRVCRRFTPKKEGDDLCFCNRPAGDHHKKDSHTKGVKWDMLQNTSEEINPAHGKLRNGAWFTQLALDTPETKVEKILLKVWRIPEPRLIMSIIGGAKYFTLSERLETNFINGIISVALKSDAWIITNGYNVGIVQLVGQAINKVKLTKPKDHLTAIGLCKWGSVKDVKNLTDVQHPKKRRTPEKSSMMEHGGEIKKREKGERDLEMNHSHYLMLDDGTIRYYEIGDYRTKLCTQLAKVQFEDSIPIPVVTVVVEGGRDTIANMYYDLRANIPVVIIDGSGRVADFFKRWLLYTKEFDNPSRDSEFPYDIGEIDNITPVHTLPPIHSNHNDASKSGATYVQLQLDKSRTKLQEKFKIHAAQLQRELDAIVSHDDDSHKRKQKKQSTDEERSKKIDIVLAQTMYCLQPAVRSGISVFNLNSDNDLSETIFRSICKARQKYFERREIDRNEMMEMNQRKSKSKSISHTKEHETNSRQHITKKDQNAQRSQLLTLAMDWNCIGVAKELILENSLDNILNKEQAFIHALLKDLPTFIYEYLKLGIDPSEIFFPNDIFFHGKDRYRKFLECLYNKDTVNEEEIQLSTFVEPDSDDELAEKHIRTTRKLNDVFRALVGGFMHKLYFDSHEGENRYRYLWGLELKRTNEQNQTDVHVVDTHEYFLNKDNKQLMQDYIMRDLFLWAILTNRIEMAKVFLCHLKYRICAALIATKILKAYYSVASYGESKENYLKMANYFEEYAIECINQCENNDAHQACQIVLQQMDLFGSVTPLQIAAHAKDKLFIATSCCVQAMNNIWYNKIHPSYSTTRSEIGMTVGVLSFGLLAPFFITYRQQPEDLKDEIPTESLQPYGINYADSYSLNQPRITKFSALNDYLHRLKNFHQAPRMKFFYHCIIYCFFLLLFSYVLLFDFEPPSNQTPSIHWTEILTIILVSFMLVEEMNHISSISNLTAYGKLTSYFRNLFKIMNLFGFILFYIGLILRFTYTSTNEQFTAARVVMAIDLEIWWLCSIAFIIVVEFLGPHLVAIGKMLKDLLFFISIIAVVMIAYGVASRSMVYYPNADIFNTTTTFDGRSIFRQIIYPVYYLMYGNFGNELSNLDANPDAAWSIATHVILALHMLLVNILLINLLIAMFSKRYDEVHGDTQNIWHSQQYLFTREYFTRSPFFPPISFFIDVYHLCRLTYFAIRRLFKKSSDRRAKVFKMIPINTDVIQEWCEFEGASTYEYAHAEVKAAKMANATSSESDSSNYEKREDTSDNTNDSNNKTDDIRQMQADLARLNQSIEEIRGSIATLVEVQTTRTTST